MLNVLLENACHDLLYYDLGGVCLVETKATTILIMNNNSC
jgi:hypothetical protein